MHKSDFPINYSSQLYLFDADKKPLFNEEPESYNTFQTVLEMEAKPSKGALYYVERGFDKYNGSIRNAAIKWNLVPLNG